MNNKKVWFQIIAWALCVIIGWALYATIQQDNIAYAERVTQLQIAANNQEETEYAELEDLKAAYGKLYEQIKAPEFICWGDSAMAGTRDSSLAISLQKVAEENLFSSLSKTFNRVFEEDDYSLPTVIVNNMGVSNEGMRQILARAGVNILDLGEGIEIPEGTDPVTVRLMDEEAWNSEDKDAQIKFAKQRDVGFGKVWISGVEGSLITTDDWFDATHPGYAFVRAEEGDWMRVGSGTEVQIESATKYRGDIPVFFFENDSGRSVDGFVADIEKLVHRYAKSTDQEESVEEQDSNGNISYDIPYVVICSTTEGSSLDKALESKFGSNYIINDTESSTASDSTYRQLAQKVYENLDDQGCFTDLKAKILVAEQEAMNR